MTTATNFILVAVGFLSVSIGVFLYRRRTLFVLFIVIGLLLFTIPFVRNWYLTRDAYEWKIVVERSITESGEPSAIVVQEIEWITSYENLARQRGRVRSLVLDQDTTRGEWRVRGFEPIAIRAEILYGSDEIALTRNFKALDPGEYTFTLSFDENGIGRWHIDAGSD